MPPAGSAFQLGVTPVTCSASDTSGNTATGSFTITVRDSTPPGLQLPGNLTLAATGPAGAMATFTVSAADLVDGPTPVSCAPASGGTFALGVTTVTCSSVDSHGNVATGSFTVRVGYQICLLYDAPVMKKSGSTYPIKLRLCDSSGRNLSSSSIVLHATSVLRAVTNTAGLLDDSGNANPDFDFRYDASLAAYIFNLSTKGIAPGTYNLNFIAGADPVPHSAQFGVR